ncbi:MAG: hypothetical protein ABL308_08045 [Oceanicaulis sp.]
MKASFVALCLAVLLPGAALAQTVSSVSGPDIKAGERELEYRLGAAFGETVDDAAFAHRVHYQQAINERLRWRVRGLWRDPSGAGITLDHVQGELHLQLIEPTPSGYSSGLRFNARAAVRDGAPDELGVTWLHQWRLDESWRVRAMASVDRELGAGASDDWFLEARASVYRSFGDGFALGVESFNDFGAMGVSFGSFDDQSHQLGPVVSGEIDAAGLEWSVGVLFGLSDGADDQDLMLRLERAL